MGGSVCLARGPEVRASVRGDASISHSNTLLRDIKQVLQESKTSLDEIELFAAAVGPGSFTGLRIGLATVKALAATLERPCLAVPTLAAVASAVGTASNVVALLPAGRGELFAQRFSVASHGVVTPLDAPLHIPPQKLIDRYGMVDNVEWAGEGAEVHRDFIADYATAHALDWRFAPLDRELAKQVVLIGLGMHREQQAIPPESLHAVYVRPSDAELKLDVVNK